METASRLLFVFFFSSRRRHTRLVSDWSSDVCSSDLGWRRERARAHAANQNTNPNRAPTIRLVRSRTANTTRSEERRVGKECRYRWWPDHEKTKKNIGSKRRDRMES